MSISGIPASDSAPVPLAVASKSPLVVSVGALWNLNVKLEPLPKIDDSVRTDVGSTINPMIEPVFFV